MKRAVIILAVVLTLAFIAYFGFRWFDASLTKGLEEEKSYTRHAMEYHRSHPEKRKGDIVLDTWSEADYIAGQVLQRGSPGDWTASSASLSYLPSDIQRDSNGVPFCVVRREGTVFVVRFVDATPNCTPEFAMHLDGSHIGSGEMEFSGRSDFWIFVQRR